MRLIQTSGCYIGLLDKASPVNMPGFLDQCLKTPRDEAAAAGTAWAALYVFNQKLIDCSQRGEMVSWFVLFDGVFGIEVELCPQEPVLVPSPEQRASVLGDSDYHLSCPSGKIIVASLDQLGQDQLKPLISVVPGQYQLVLTTDDEAESQHSFLEEVADYPEGDGPDWRIQLQRVLSTDSHGRRAY